MPLSCWPYDMVIRRKWCSTMCPADIACNSSSSTVQQTEATMVVSMISRLQYDGKQPFHRQINGGQPLKPMVASSMVQQVKAQWWSAWSCSPDGWAATCWLQRHVQEAESAAKIPLSMQCNVSLSWIAGFWQIFSTEQQICDRARLAWAQFHQGWLFYPTHFTLISTSHITPHSSADGNSPVLPAVTWWRCERGECRLATEPSRGCFVPVCPSIQVTVREDNMR